MSKWNKQNKPLSDEFLENQERRKQIIIEAARRRKQKEKKIQQEDQRDRREQQEALKRHKQQKKDAYIKYLHNNLHDKYEQLQRIQKQAKPQIKSNAKWKKKTVQQNTNQLEALDLEVKMQPQIQQQTQKQLEKQPSTIKNQRQELIQQFQKEWVLQQSKDELLGSKLLDSLDLDIDTINRGKQVKKIMQERPKPDDIKELRQLIGYQSVLFGQKDESKLNPSAKEIKINKQIKQMKQISKNNKITNANTAKKSEINQVETLNELKRKKQAKILNWAIEQQQEAEDLFSNCSSKKKPTLALKELNQQLKNAKQNKINSKINNNLPTISEQTAKKQVPIVKQLPIQNKSPPVKPHTVRNSNQRQQIQRQPVISTQPNFKKTQKRTSSHKQQSVDKKKSIQQQAGQTKKSSKTTTGFSSQKNLIRMRAKSRDKPKNQSKQKQKQQKVQPLKIVQVPKKIGGQLPPLPARPDNNSIATYDIQIDIESFIKQDLLNLNEEQMKIQQQLRQIHKEHKNDIKDVYNKYQIKTDYKHSNEILGGQPTKPQKYYQNEDDIEQSLQNLDNILIRKELVSRQKENAIKEVTEEDSLSYINPFSNSEDLCNQILKLAKNVSRFEKKPQQPSKDGYGAMMNKVKKNQNSSFQNNKQKSRISRDKQTKQSKYEEQGLSQSQDVSRVTEALGRPPNILQMSPKQEKIHVNTKLLKNLLLDDY